RCQSRDLTKRSLPVKDATVGIVTHANESPPELMTATRDAPKSVTIVSRSKFLENAGQRPSAPPGYGRVRLRNRARPRNLSAGSDRCSSPDSGSPSLQAPPARAESNRGPTSQSLSWMTSQRSRVVHRAVAIRELQAP